MRLIVISDYLGHEEYLEPLRDVVEEDDFDALVFTGGMAEGKESISEYTKALVEGREPGKEKDGITEEKKKKKEEIKKFLEYLTKFDLPVLFVPGHTDTPLEMYEDLVNIALDKTQNLHYVHLKFLQLDKFIFSGCGGIIGDESEEFFQYKIPVGELKSRLKNLKTFRQEKVMVVHTPPSVGEGDEIEESSEYVDEVIKFLKPKILFYGMIDPENKMRVINDTVVITPGPLYEGNYCIVNTKTMSVEFENLDMGEED
ncbi:MAG: metallophosphoesterase [Thermoplasmatota archaeon]